MKKLRVALTAAILSGIGAPPGMAGPLPPDTTIYIGVGVRDSGGAQSELRDVDDIHLLERQRGYGKLAGCHLPQHRRPGRRAHV